MLATSLSIPLNPGDVWFFLNIQINFLWFHAHLNCANHKGKYLRLKYYKKIVFVYELYIKLFTLYLFIVTENMVTAFSPLGGLMCPHNKKTLCLPMSCTCSPPKRYSSPCSNRSGILDQNFVSKSPGFYSSAIYLSKNYLSVLRTPLDVVSY